MSASTNRSFSKFNSLFNNEEACAENKTQLDFISYICDDDHIQMLNENNW